jgi:hypothetical protein
MDGHELRYRAIREKKELKKGAGSREKGVE